MTDRMDDSKRSREDLLEEISALRDALDSISDGFIFYDAEDRIVAFNAKQKELFPSVADVLEIGVHYRDILAAQVASGQIDNAIGREEAWVEERVKSHQIADGTPREQVFADGRVVRLSEHRTSSGGIVSLRTDITDLKAAQSQLRESEQQYRDLAQLNPDAFVIQVDGRIAFANESARRMFLADSVEALIGLDALQFVHPDYRDEILQRRLDAMDRDETYDYQEFVHVRMDGSEYPSEMITAPIDWRGKRGTMNIIHDLTAHKQAEAALLESEQRFRAIAESSPVPMVITRRTDGIILYANPQIETVLGVTPADTVGTAVSGYFWEPSARNERAQMVEEEGFVDHSYLDMRHRDGRRIPTDHSLRLIDYDGVPCILGAFMDISEQRSHEEELQRAKEAAEAANASKTQFLAIMSHELRTPLNAIIGFSEVILTEVFGPMANERYQEYVADIHGSASHLLALLTDILDLSRIEAGHMERVETIIELNDVIGDCVALVNGRATSKDVAIKTHLPKQELRVKADLRQTKQILINLLTNAVKFTHDGTTVHIHAETTCDGDLDLRVVDQGAGVPADKLDWIVQPFTRLEGTHTSRVDGTGLGLAIVKSLIEGHGGKLKLRSVSGQGTEATVSFPQSRLQHNA